MGKKRGEGWGVGVVGVVGVVLVDYTGYFVFGCYYFVSTYCC